MIQITKQDLMNCPDKGNGIRSLKHYLRFDEHAVKHTEESFPSIENTFDRIKHNAPRGEKDEGQKLFDKLYSQERVMTELKELAKAMKAVPGVHPEKGVEVSFGNLLEREKLTVTPAISFKFNFSMS